MADSLAKANIRRRKFRTLVFDRDPKLLELCIRHLASMLGDDLRRYGTPICACLLSVLPAFTYYKIASVQASDVVLLCLLSYGFWSTLAQKLVIRVSTGMAYLAKSYCLLIGSTFILLCLNMTQTFYPLYDVSFLLRPGLLPMAKLIQLASVIYGFIWLGNIFSRNKALYTKALDLYWWTGVIGATYAIAWYLASSATHIYATPDSLIASAYSAEGGGIYLRARGFFNEGGPYGVYLVSVYTIGVLRRQIKGKLLGFGSASLIAAFLMSASKAGFFVAATLMIYSVLTAASLRKRLLYFSVAASISLSVAMYLGLGGLLVNYVDDYDRLGANAAVLGRNPNVGLGRIAASYLVPRMIAARPFIGIGIGNYPLIRNDPRYLGSLPAIMNMEDLPALGFPGIAAELGLPLTIWLLFLLFVPFRNARRYSAMIGIAALVQPLAHGVGVQITFFYPWFTSACAIAALSHSKFSPHVIRPTAI